MVPIPRSLELLSKITNEGIPNKNVEDVTKMVVVFGSAAKYNFEKGKFNDVDIAVIFKNDVTPEEIKLAQDYFKKKHSLNLNSLVKGYGPSIKIQYGPSLGDPVGGYHSFYCKENELGIKDKQGVPFIQNHITLFEN